MKSRKTLSIRQVYLLFPTYENGYSRRVMKNNSAQQSCKKHEIQLIVIDRHGHVSDKALLHIKRCIESTFTRLQDGVRQVRITFRDEKGPKGGKGIRCHLGLKLDTWDEIFASAIDENVTNAAVLSVGNARKKLESRNNSRPAWGISGLR